MAKTERVVWGNFDEVLNGLDEAIINSGVSMQLVDYSYKEVNGSKVALRVYDKYFYRSSNRASLSLSVISSGDQIHVSAIGAGGGQGVFFRFSWGAESSILTPVIKYLDSYDNYDR